MSKVSNALNMYFLLKNRGIASAEEIAQELEISKRMVNTYKNDLEMAGIHIASKRGVGGGYYLENQLRLSDINLTQHEKNLLQLVKEQVISSNQAFAKDFEILISKILYNTGTEDQFYFSKAISKTYQNRQQEEKWLADVHQAIQQQKVLCLQYRKLGPHALIEESREVEPYEIISYQANLYLAARCLKRQAFRYFKLSRIQQLKITKQTFIRQENFSLSESMRQNFGIYSEDPMRLKLKIAYPFSVIVQENLYVPNQKITSIEGGIIFEAQMQGRTEIETWLLSMGENVTVLEPATLRDTLQARLRAAHENYQEEHGDD